LRHLQCPGVWGGHLLRRRGAGVAGLSAGVPPLGQSAFGQLLGGGVPLPLLGNHGADTKVPGDGLSAGGLSPPGARRGHLSDDGPRPGRRGG